MSEEEATPSDRLQELSGGFSIGQQAAVATAGAVLTGALLAVVGLVLDLGRNQVLVALACLVLLVLVAVVYAFFRAMMLSADESDGDPLVALTYPLFPALYLLLAIAVGLFIGLYLEFAA